MDYSLNLKEVTHALSEALDLVGIDDTLHGKRVAYMAAEIAKQLQWPEEDIETVIFAGMIHDCGVSSTDVHNHLVNELDWDNANIHCVRGNALLKQTSLYKKYAEIILYHHTHWDAFDENIDLKTKKISNLIYLSDRIDALNAQMKNMGTKATQLIQQTIASYKGTMFCNEFVDAFLEVSSKGSFWFYIEEDALQEYFSQWMSSGVEEPMTFTHLKEIALMFAAVVDAKSTFTSEHSISVASISRFLAEKLELSQASCELIELAALLHDLGKLRVDDNILNKPSSLNADERLKMNRHGFDSDIILSRIHGFKEIAKLASLHHETLDGEGYPYKLSAQDIPLEARVIAIADIFQALIQDRPYRGSLSADDAYNILLEMVDDGKIDSEIVALLGENIEECASLSHTKYSIEES